MPDIISKIKKDAEKREVTNDRGPFSPIMYVDHDTFKKGDQLDLITNKIKFKKKSHIVFVDEQPGTNWSHKCHYLVYDATTGAFIERVDAEFPPTMTRKSNKPMELFRSNATIGGFKRKKKLTIPLEPAKLSSWRKFDKLPLAYKVTGKRYCIMYSGHSNCRHVNDMEFLFRTLVDVYGYDPADIYICNYDGTINWNAEAWEPAAPCNYPVDGTPFRMHVNAEGNRTGFQDVISELAPKITKYDCVLLHTNNHGGWNNATNEGFMSGWGGAYYANDFANDLAQLPNFRTLLAFMEPCHAGAFNQPIMNNSPASRTVVQAAVPWDENSAGGWFFDPWAEMWISAMAGVRGDGSALATSPDDNLDNKISAFEAFDYAIAIDNPVMDESSPDLSKNIFLSKCSTLVKHPKEFKEIKEKKEIKEPKELKEKKEYKEKELKEKKEFKEKEVKEKKEFKEPKELKEKKEYKEKELKEKKEFKEPKELKEYAEEKKLFEHEPKMREDYPVDHLEFDKKELALLKRIERIEHLLENLKPFIDGSDRPNLDDAPYTE